MDKEIKRIGVLTSGGDAPGMNGLIRSVVRASRYHGLECMGIRRGFHGLMKGDTLPLMQRDVSDVLQRGGTFLMTARSEAFMTEEGQNKAVSICDVFNLDCVVCIGGDGTWHGAQSLARKGIKVMALPASIDNDVASSEYSIGYDTAMNTALSCIDRIRDTASSHERCSVVEVMGRHNGFLALQIGIATGAELVLIPEHPVDFMDHVVGKVLSARNRGKHHYIIIVAEGVGNAEDIARRIEEVTGIESRATNLGYVQRGGNPSLQDRYMASIMGIKAITSLIEGRSNRAIVVHGGQVVDVDLDEALSNSKTIPEESYKQVEILAY